MNWRDRFDDMIEKFGNHTPSVQLYEEHAWLDKYVMVYTRELINHLVYFAEAAIQLGIDENTIVMHDSSKYMTPEYFGYAVQYGGGSKGTPIYREAWLHHIHNNPHHWQHWIIPEETLPVEMSEHYVLEMVADWMGSQMAYTGKWDMTEWLRRNARRIKLHPKSNNCLHKILVDNGYGAEFLRNIGIGWKSIIEPQ